MDNELFDPKELREKNKRKRKWMLILPYECDGVFIYSYDGKILKEKNFYVGDEYLKEYIEGLD